MIGEFSSDESQVLAHLDATPTRDTHVEISYLQTPNTSKVVTDTILTVLQDQSTAFKEFMFYAKQSLLANKISTAHEVEQKTKESVVADNAKDITVESITNSQNVAEPNATESTRDYPTADSGRQRARSISGDSTSSLSALIQSQAPEHSGAGGQSLVHHAGSTVQPQDSSPTADQRSRAHGADDQTALPKVDVQALQGEDELLDELLDDYEDVEDETVTDDIHPVLAKRINGWLVTKAKPKELKQLYDKCKRAKNLLNLRSVAVNAPLYSLMTSKLKDWDRKQKLPCNALQHALCPLTLMLDKLIKLEAVLPKNSDGVHVIKQGTHVENITDMRRQLALAIQIIAFTFASLTYRRRTAIRGCIDSSFGSICSAEKPFMDLLFGDDLEAMLTSLTTTNKLKLKAARKQFNHKARPYYARGSKNWGWPRLGAQSPPQQQTMYQASYPRGRGPMRRGYSRRPHSSGSQAGHHQRLQTRK